MTMPHTPLSIDDAKRLGDAIGPSIRESMRDELNDQTNDFQKIVDSHEGTVQRLIETHEESDNTRFSKIDATLRENKEQIRHIEIKLSRAAGAIIVIMMLFPVLWDLLKWKMGMK